MPTLQMDLKALETKTNTEINEFHRFVISYYATTPIKFFQLIVITFVVCPVHSSLECTFKNPLQWATSKNGAILYRFTFCLFIQYILSCNSSIWQTKNILQ